MSNKFDHFEAIARRAGSLSTPQQGPEGAEHAFEGRNIYPDLPPKVRRLFDGGHFAEATFEAAKYLDKKIHQHSTSSDSGFKLMMSALGGDSPEIKLTPMLTTSERDEQKGYQFLFAGSVLAIRNPRGHEHSIADDEETCLDHLSFISMLFRRLADAGYT